MTLSCLLLEQEAHNGRTKLFPVWEVILQWAEPSTRSDGDYELITGELTDSSQWHIPQLITAFFCDRLRDLKLLCRDFKFRPFLF
jgi:hypothetical protein